MNNLALGKTLKAMYKLSGKTLTQLSDETDLTVDTINNLFYARIQKPGLAGVNRFGYASEICPVVFPPMGSRFASAFTVTITANAIVLIHFKGII